MFQFTDLKHSSRLLSFHFSHEVPLNEAIFLLNKTESTRDKRPTDTKITQAPNLNNTSVMYSVSFEILTIEICWLRRGYLT